MPLQIGQTIDGKFRILRMIGEGGMGSVYEGENLRVRRRVAIKVLHQAYSSNTDILQRFEREAQAAGRIGNDHILEVIDLGVLPDGDHFMVMEFLDGEPLSDRIRRFGRLTPQQTAPLGRQLLRGLAAAHAAGIVHRDLKPDNIYVLKEKAGVPDFVKIIDFGISKFQPLSGDAMKMTRTGAVMGTPYYMSPEQASGSKDADSRSDLYAVGVILFEAVTGRVPFDAPTFNALMFQIVLSEVLPPQAYVPDLDPAFCSIITKAMARDVNHRFQTAAEFADALELWMSTGSAVSLPPPGSNPLIRLPSGTARTQPLPSPATPVQPPLAVAAGGSAPPTPQTPGSWAASATDDVIPKQSALPLLAVAAVGLLVAAGGIGGAAYAFWPRSPNTATKSDNVTSVSPPAASAKLIPATAPSGPMPSPLASNSAPTRSDEASPSPSGSGASPANAPAPSSSMNAELKPRVQPGPRPLNRPEAPPVEPKPTQKPATATPKPTSGGVDFGY